MTLTEMEEKIEEEVKGLSTYLEGDDYTNACNDAARDTGWSFPVTTDFKIKWTKDRAKRHLFFYLYSESAYKFKYEQINLQQRFEHLGKIIDKMDKQYEEALESFPNEFADVDSYELFGTKADAGFQYDPLTGKDTTYSDNNKVVFAPGGEDD